ncbi:hypothetical protein MUK42_37112 [Musa troglodytarum]|uniref:Uncharacterized protein n=1 Tax=Musa troglodytarum TaxID=320322 RepID=A0A9E7EGS9_9LILI|nr:hypothetical protein MUK42_37112 [Musa troglodytarum]
MRAESPEKNTDMISRQTDYEDKTTSHAHKDKILLVPQANVLLANEKDLLAGREVSHNKLNVILVDDDDQVEENCREESECVRSAARVTVAKPSADILPANEASDCGAEPLHLQIIQNYGRGEPKDQSKKGQAEFNSSTGIQPCRHRNLDICNYEQMGPRMEMVVQSNCNFEVLAYGIVLSGKLWSTCQRIFLKGLVAGYPVQHEWDAVLVLVSEGVVAEVILVEVEPVLLGNEGIGAGAVVRVGRKIEEIVQPGRNMVQLLRDGGLATACASARSACYACPVEAEGGASGPL